MIPKLFSSSSLTKSERKKFIPFVNERDFMGSLIMDEPKIIKNDKDTLQNNLTIIENLKKTTKQYFFDKKYSKMMSKLKRIQGSMCYKELDYEAKVDRCLKTINKSSRFLKKRISQEKYYTDVHQQLSSKITGLKDSLIKKIMLKRSQTLQKNRFKNTTLSDQFDQKQYQMTRHATVQKDHWELRNSRKITKQIFKAMGGKTVEMIDFTNAGLKYKPLVENRKINPWKKWYSKEELQLFPGEKIMIRKLKKSIY